MPRGKNNAYNGKRNENSSFDYGLILMTNNKKHFSDFELKQLLREVETRQLTDKEIDILREMYLVRFGTAMNGMCLNPYWLLNEIEIEAYIDEESQEEIEAWKTQALIDDFEDTPINIPNVDISFICNEPNDCYSFKKNGMACQCIRDNFDSPRTFQAWRERQLSKLGKRLQDIIPLD